MPPRTIDVHCHYLPPSLFELLRREGDGRGIAVAGEGADVRFVIGGRKSRPMPEAMTDLDVRLRWMDRRGIDVQVLSAWVEVTAYELPAEHGAWLARRLNEAAAEAIAVHPARFRMMASVPLQDPDAATRELGYAVSELGMTGVGIAGTSGTGELDHPSLEPFWSAAEALRAPVLIHPHKALGGGFERYLFWNILGNPAEETIAASHLIFGGVLDRHPELVVCLTHGGGFLPYQVGRADRGFHAVPRAAAAGMDRPPSEYLGRFFYDTITHDVDALRFLVERVGADRVLVGSDYPFPMGDPDPVAGVEKGVAGGAERQAILSLNASRAFGLDA